MRFKRKPVLFSIAVLLMLILLCAIVLFIIPLTETGDHSPVEGSDSWMTDLNDDLLLSEVTLPGSHDSAAINARLGFFSKCQSLSIREQLDAGTRYLDVRFSAEDDGIYLVHGFVSCLETASPFSGRLRAEDYLQDCYDFLAEHPSETIVFVVKQEHSSLHDGDFELRLFSLIQQQPQYWLLTDTIPTVGEARGKLVLMRRYTDGALLGSDAGIGCDWSSQGGHENTALTCEPSSLSQIPLTVQDRYEYNAEDKWFAFTQSLGVSAGKAQGEVFINFLSTKGTAVQGHPYHFASVLNPQLQQAEGLNGWIIVDFISAPLAEHIYSSNFR